LTLTLSRGTGRGNQRPFVVGIVFLLFVASHALAQTASLPSPLYRPGRYVPLRLEAETAGLVRVSGIGVQGVDWPAPGRSSVVVPLLIYEAADAVSLTINGREVQLPTTPLPREAADPAELSAFWQTIDPIASTSPAIDPDAYALAALWQPGRDVTTRRWTLVAVAVVVLTLGIAAHADLQRATRWLIVAAVGLSAGLFGFYPADAPRRVLPAEGRAGREWVWHAATTGRVAEEPWSPGLRFVPQSVGSSNAANAVLRCDPTGRPVALAARIDRGGRAVFVRPVVRPSVGPSPLTPAASSR
ncbi:MAG TPA: hypothetical protein VF595_11695, partial [Tepidisphaeraceae bacterium]